MQALYGLVCSVQEFSTAHTSCTTLAHTNTHTHTLIRLSSCLAQPGGRSDNLLQGQKAANVTRCLSSVSCVQFLDRYVSSTDLWIHKTYVIPTGVMCSLIFPSLCGSDIMFAVKMWFLRPLCLLCIISRRLTSPISGVQRLGGKPMDSTKFSIARMAWMDLWETWRNRPLIIN